MTLWHNGGIMCGFRELNAGDPLHDQATELQRGTLRLVDKPVAHRLKDEFADVSCDPKATDQINCCPILVH